ncbi:MAG: chemotaxis protein CheA [Phycisphaerales bacterium]|nr:chemotaxis protein CheA [Phycisphaerales bacterium]
MSSFDPQIVQDFLTESGELLSQLESDLVTLEQDPCDPEMLNQVFRALHTIKGSASFLSLSNLVKIAHAAESALNAARNRVVVIDRDAMDALLKAVDLIKEQMGQLAQDAHLSDPDDGLVAVLTALGEGKQKRSASSATEPGTASTPAATPSGPALADGDKPLVLGEGKKDLLEFLIGDLDESLSKAREQAARLFDAAAFRDAASQLFDLADAISRSVDFFEVAPMTRLCVCLRNASQAFGEASAEVRAQLAPRIGAIIAMLASKTDALRKSVICGRSFGQLVDRVELLISGELPEALLAAGATADDALALDVGHGAGGAALTDEPDPATRDLPAPIVVPEPADVGSSVTASAPMSSFPSAAPAAGDARAEKEPSKRTATPGGDHTIRVEVNRLEALMNLVGELVLQKNRIAAITRQLGAVDGATQDSREQMLLAASGLDRVTADIQVAVMRTRMQPLEKLFSKYPRLIRDLCGKTGKKIELIIEGGETEVDKSVIEELGDPLVHLLRNAADHGLELPADRVAAGKSETGTITLRASHEGSHVQLLIIDDGRGLNRDKIGAKAVERGLVRAEDLANLPDDEVFHFIFLPGFSTADSVSDLSGRGVGMDVVRTNIEKLKGLISLSSQQGKGTTVAITIPLTVAILPAMMVGVGEEVYAVPLNNILEIVKPDPASLSSIGGRSVMRLRDSVLPLISAAELFELPAEGVQTPFAVVLSMNNSRVGLLVTRLIGQQEIVIKPLDGVGTRGGAAGGATVRDDGGVSLIIDVAELIRMAQGRTNA